MHPCQPVLGSKKSLHHWTHAGLNISTCMYYCVHFLTLLIHTHKHTVHHMSVFHVYSVKCVVKVNMCAIVNVLYLY